MPSSRSGSIGPDSEADAIDSEVQSDEAWDRFARQNRGDAAENRWNVLDCLWGAARVRLAGIYAKLLAGEVSEHSERFACSRDGQALDIHQLDPLSSSRRLGCCTACGR